MSRRKAEKAMKTVDILGANRFDNYTKTREGSRAIIICDDGDGSCVTVPDVTGAQ